MTSLLSGTKQMSNEIGYFINVGSLVDKVLMRVEPTSGSNSGVNGGSFSTAVWATIVSPSQNGYPAGLSPVSSLATAGQAILKDMGRTVVSSLRTFRKVQLVVPNVSSFGVGGPAGVAAGPGQDYFTGYIELGFEGTAGTSRPAPVAHFGR
jgi:hypothetical protein